MFNIVDIGFSYLVSFLFGDGYFASLCYSIVT